jgi:hypothetical protein
MTLTVRALLVFALGASLCIGTAARADEAAGSAGTPADVARLKLPPQTIRALGVELLSKATRVYGDEVALRHVSLITTTAARLQAAGKPVSDLAQRTALQSRVSMCLACGRFKANQKPGGRLPCQGTRCSFYGKDWRALTER